MKNRKMFQTFLTILALSTFLFTACNKDYIELPESELTADTSSDHEGSSNGSASTRYECPQGDVILTSQIEVDSFSVQYSNCSILDGSLTIESGPDPIFTLEPLGFLLEIKGSLIIRENPELENLSGLNSIWEIDMDWIIEDNNALTDLSDLESLESIGGSLIVINNAQLNSLMGGSDGDLFFKPMIPNDVKIVNNPALVSLHGLHEVEEIGRDLIIDNNNSLINLHDLESLESIGSSFIVINNAKLNSYTGANNDRDPILVGFVKIENNPQLSACADVSLCSFLDNGGQVVIKNNAQGCNSISQVKAECDATMDCGTFAPRTWVTNIKRHSLKINWDPVKDADLYKVHYRKRNSSNPWKVKQTSNTYKTLFNLLRNTNFGYQHKYRCSSGWSGWGDLKFFKTKP